MTTGGLDPSFAPEDPALRRGRMRIGLVSALFALLFGAVAFRLLHLAPEERELAAAAVSSPEPERRRPDLLDRRGALLATDILVPSLAADPLLVTDPKRTAERLARLVPGLVATELERRLIQAKAAGRRFLWIEHRITPAVQRAVLEAGLPGIVIRRADHRVYPKGAAAAHLVGFVDVDNRGLAGFEHALDFGRAQSLRGRDAIALSLDLRVQEAVREELGRAFREFRALGACGIVLDVRTGELLALVSLPDFDPNLAARARAEQRKNRCTGGSYELGSLFKLLSLAAALESGRVRVTQRFEIPSALVIGRHRIRDVHPARRPYTVAEIFSHSSNIGTALAVFAAGGAEPLRGMLARLGLFERAPIELLEVARPQLQKSWPDVVTATVSFGHGIAVSPLRFAEAVASLVGEGARVTATVLARSPAASPEPAERVASPRTVEELRWMMWLAVAEGTAKRAAVPGYLLGGKTGTADKAGRGGYRRGAVLASFVGVFPLERPRYLVLAMLDEPQATRASGGTRYGGQVAAPVVAAIVARIGPLLGVPPSDPALEARYRERWHALRATAGLSETETRLAAVAPRP
ncbi:MAG: penicillin-binding protein 2 [Geminicoccaceae bacterium]|nr:penicillin-binding protein 2 [Geminicoccaceae bacterium]MDW8341174.1 penicillin-binding protein 2 [Geminicoccaceae bacterium]